VAHDLYSRDTSWDLLLGKVWILGRHGVVLEEHDGALSNKQKTADLIEQLLEAAIQNLADQTKDHGRPVRLQTVGGESERKMDVPI